MPNFLTTDYREPQKTFRILLLGAPGVGKTGKIFFYLHFSFPEIFLTEIKFS